MANRQNLERHQHEGHDQQSQIHRPRKGKKGQNKTQFSKTQARKT